MKSFKSLYAYSFVGVAAATQLLSVGVAKADFSNNSSINPSGSSDFSSGSNTNITNVANTIINIVLLISGILAVFYLIWSGIQYITSAGSADKAKTARAGIINAVIGIIVIVAAFFIVRFAIGIGNSATGN